MVSSVGAAWKQARYVTVGVGYGQGYANGTLGSLLPLVVLSVAPGSPAGKNPEGSFGAPKSHSVGAHRPRGTRQHELQEGGEVEGGLGYN